MKHCNYVITALLMGAIAPCHSMEKAALITALTTKSPRSIACLKNNNIAVLGKNDLTIYDFSTNKKIVLLEKYSDETIFQFITVDQKKEKLASFRKYPLTIYDLKTNRLQWTTEHCDKDNSLWQGAPVFNPTQSNILIGNIIYGIDSFNYPFNSLKRYAPFSREGIPFATQLAFHPTEQKVLFLADTRVELPILQLDKEPLIEKIISTNCNEYNDTIIGATYNSDGSLIAINHQIRGCSLYNLIDETNSFVNEGEQVAAMIFYPATSIIAMLPQTGDCIKYWDTKTSKLIISTTLEESYVYPATQLVPLWNPISFSDDGTKIVIALEDKNKCLIIDVPSEVLEQSTLDQK